jgi:hypothetical protein
VEFEVIFMFVLVYRFFLIHILQKYE